MKKLLALFAVSVTTLAHADVQVKDAWIRTSTGPNGALFMQIENDSPKLEALIDAKTDSEQCDHMELHTHLHEDGKMMMRQVDSIEVPEEGVAELKPGGLHIMLMGLKKPLKEGEIIPVTFTFKDGQTIQADVPVKSSMPGAHSSH